MDSLKRLVIEAGNKKGGALLNVIYRLMINSSDKSIRDLFEFILEKSSVPYIGILKKWIFEGILDDNFEEFIVKENAEFKKEQVSQDLNNLYWLERFTFREEMIPNFLLKYKQKVLHTGKYLNVIRETGRDIKYTSASLQDREAFPNSVVAAYQQEEHEQIDSSGLNMPNIQNQ
jgi:gamma-tubulin complex component 2